MKKPNKTDYEIKQILKYNRDGSPDRQKIRYNNLMRMVSQLQDRNYKKTWDIHKLGKKEVYRLVDTWRGQNLSHRTIANRMVDIRWLASKVNRSELIPSNKDIGCGLRKNAPNYGESKAIKADYDKINQLSEREKLITLMRVEFGLRTEEALKFSHAYATKNNDSKISLKGSWCKGGRPREIPITTNKQVKLLDLVKAHQIKHNDRSMIPHDKNFKGYYRSYNRIKADHDIKGHEYRHQWAQKRFEQVSGGLKSPHAGGASKWKDLTKDEAKRWRAAATTVNRELGHGENRQDITATYIGSMN